MPGSVQNYTQPWPWALGQHDLSHCVTFFNYMRNVYLIIQTYEVARSTTLVFVFRAETSPRGQDQYQEHESLPQTLDNIFFFVSTWHNFSVASSSSCSFASGLIVPTQVFPLDSESRCATCWPLFDGPSQFHSTNYISNRNVQAINKRSVFAKRSVSPTLYMPWPLLSGI